MSLSKVWPLLFAVVFSASAQAQTLDRSRVDAGAADAAAVEDIDPNIRCIAIALAFESEMNQEQKSQPLMGVDGARAVIDTALFLYGLDSVKIDPARADPKEKTLELIENGLYSTIIQTYPDKVVENYQGWFRIHALEYELIQCITQQSRTMLDRFENVSQ